MNLSPWENEQDLFADEREGNVVLLRFRYH